MAASLVRLAALALAAAAPVAGKALVRSQVAIERAGVRAEGAVAEAPHYQRRPETSLISCEYLPENLTTWAMPPWVAQHREAALSICKDEANWPYMQVWLDERFRDNYNKFYRGDGWAEEAWVNYVKAKQPKDDYWAALTERLVDSVHRFSSKPIVVINFGEVELPQLEPTRFPQLVLLHARNLEDRGISFNFNKIQAILLARVKVGVSLDSDMMMAGPQGDSLMSRTKEEITEKYRFPMMPVHFLDRDPADASSGKGNFLLYTCGSCPKPTMRWGQAQPSWTYWSMPFLARWQAAKIAGRPEQGVPTADIGEDEDLLNVALWREGATKEWCAFQTGGADFIWENFFPQHAPGPYPYYEDPKRFPMGVPVAYFFAHAEKNVNDVDRALRMLQEQKDSGAAWPKPYYHDMKFYSTFEELKKEHPDVGCTL